MRGHNKSNIIANTKDTNLALIGPFRGSEGYFSALIVVIEVPPPPDIPLLPYCYYYPTLMDI